MLKMMPRGEAKSKANAIAEAHDAVSPALAHAFLMAAASIPWHDDFMRLSRFAPLLFMIATASILSQAQGEQQGGWKLLSSTSRTTHATRTAHTSGEGKSATPPSSQREPLVQHWVKRVAEQPDGSELDLQLLLLKRGATTLQVIDLNRAVSLPGMPPIPPTMRSVAEGLQQAGAVAGVNGGYFQHDNAPLGLVIHNGKEEHAFQTSKILTGLLVVTPRGASLLRNAEFRSGFHKGAFKGAPVREALQSGPFLVDKGAPVVGLNATRAAERTVLLADKKGVAALLVTPSITLAGLSKLLATPGLFAELKIERALNLDGGSSTAMWVGVGEKPFSRSEWKRVRNAVGVMPLEPSKSH